MEVRLRFLLLLIPFLGLPLHALGAVTIKGQIHNDEPYVWISVGGSDHEDLFFVDSGAKDSLLNELT